MAYVSSHLTGVCTALLEVPEAALRFVIPKDMEDALRKNTGIEKKFP